MQNQILVDPRVANTHRSSFDIGQRHHRLVMEWTAFQRHQRQNFLSDHELYYYKAELTAMMLFGQLLNVKMTSMAGDSKKQSTAIPLHSVHNYGLGNLLASIAHHTAHSVWCVKIQIWPKFEGRKYKNWGRGSMVCWMKSVIFKSLDDVGLFFMMCQSLKIIDSLLLLRSWAQRARMNLNGKSGPKPKTITAWKLACFFLCYGLFLIYSTH